jgi:hypothetical protein
LATNLTRFLMPYLILVSLAALAMGALNSMESFFVPAPHGPCSGQLGLYRAVSCIILENGNMGPCRCGFVGRMFSDGPAVGVVCGQGFGANSGHAGKGSGALA